MQAEIIDFKMWKELHEPAVPVNQRLIKCDCGSHTYVMLGVEIRCEMCDAIVGVF